MQDSDWRSYVNLRTARWRVAALLLAVVAGCNKSADLAPVVGQVSYNGKPLQFGTVMFQHEQGGQPSQAEIQPDGTFTLSTYSANDGARIGLNRVAVYCYESQNPSRASTRSAGEQSLGKLLIPQRYAMFSTSGLTAEVLPDSNEPFVFELTDN